MELKRIEECFDVDVDGWIWIWILFCCGAEDEDRARSFLPPNSSCVQSGYIFVSNHLPRSLNFLHVGIHCSYVEGPSSCCRRHCPQQQLTRDDDKVEQSPISCSCCKSRSALGSTTKRWVGKDGGSNRVSVGAQTSIIYGLSCMGIGCDGSVGIPLDVSAPIPSLFIPKSHIYLSLSSSTFQLQLIN